jgi:signal transduction histidine kinase
LVKRQTLRFAIVSGCILLIAGAVLGVIHRSASLERLESMAERQNVALTKVFANAAWGEFRNYVAQAGLSDPEALRNTAEVAALGTRIMALMQGSSIAKVKIYDKEGLTVYSTDRAEIGIRKRNEGFEEAKAGGIANEMERANEMLSFDGIMTDRNVVSTYLPLFAPGGNTDVEAVIEVYDDVTDLVAAIDQDELFAAGVLGAVQLLIYLGLVLIVYRSDQAVERAHARELKLSAAAARAEAASQAKSEFLANMSHELRTPLNAIIGFAEIIKNGVMGPIQPPAYQTYLDDIWSAATHLGRVINDILDLTKAEAGKMQVERVEFNIVEILDRVRRILQEQAARAHLRVEIEPDGNEAVRITSDERKIQQVLLNLLSNAIKFTPPEGRVTLSAQRLLDRVEISVRDTGIGMTAEEIPIALSPFGQVDSSLSRKYEGTGIGLPLSKRLTQLLGGELMIESQKGAGTNVRIQIPDRTAANRPAAEARTKTDAAA